MEQLAVIQALNSIKIASNIIVYTDSMYIVGTYNNNWQRQMKILKIKRKVAIKRQNDMK